LQGSRRPAGGYCRRQSDALHFLLQGRRTGGAARPASRRLSLDVRRLFAAGDGVGAARGWPRQVEGIPDATADEWIVGSGRTGAQCPGNSALWRFADALRWLAKFRARAQDSAPGMLLCGGPRRVRRSPMARQDSYRYLTISRAFRPRSALPPMGPA